MLCAAGRDDTGRPIAQVDHLSSELTAEPRQQEAIPARLVDLLLALAEVFGEDLPADPKFRHSLQQAVATLQERGAAAQWRPAWPGGFSMVFEHRQQQRLPPRLAPPSGESLAP
jgi:mannitol-1-phosphate/altronate dehydrogenase